ncbi:putative hemolysin [Dysgonomonadaceae bacterium PH5-43]|nr:putative hemolysin [Dysgonomonadaceae bacterium PH5-43]
MSNDIFQINVKDIIKNKAPKLYKKLPAFVINWLAKLICQDGVNDILRKNANVTGVDFMENAIKDFGVSLNLKGKENLPSINSKCIFVSNHPLGGLDGICLSAVLGRRYNKQIKYLVNDILYFLTPLREIFIPINKHGSQAKSAIVAINDAFASENQIITFPAGLCSRKNNGKIKDLEWKKMFVTKAIEYKRDIVPVFFEAQNSNLFYNIANIRKKIGIKFNIEMLLLPKEMFKAKGSTFTIHFGKPISWETLDSSKSHQQWAEEIKNIVYNIK